MGGQKCIKLLIKLSGKKNVLKEKYKKWINETGSHFIRFLPIENIYCHINIIIYIEYI